MDNTLPIYATAVSIGLVHGIEPGHGWPVAAVYALNHRNRWWYGVWAGFILAAAHLVSSFAAVLVFVLADHVLGLNSLAWIGRLAGVALIVMGGIEWWRGGHAHGRGHTHGTGDVQGPEPAHGSEPIHGHEHVHGSGHSHVHQPAYSQGPSHPLLPNAAVRGSLLSLVTFAFALGFLHEEEFAILALSAGRTNPWILMTMYALAVTVSLIILTCLAMATLRIFEERLRKLDRYLPRVSAVVLILMGLAYFFGWV